jgi:hypothetical protein
MVHVALALIVPPVQVIVLEPVVAVSVPFRQEAFFAGLVVTPVVLTFVTVMPVGRLSVMLTVDNAVSEGALMLICSSLSPVPFAMVVVLPNAIEVGANVFVTVGGVEAVIPIGAVAAAVGTFGVVLRVLAGIVFV